MRRLIVLVVTLIVVGTACSDDVQPTTTSTEPPVTTTAAAATTTVPPTAETTTTSFLPLSQPNPELEALSGVWVSETINSWSIRLSGFTIVGGGNPTNLVIPGTVDLEDGVFIVRGVDLGVGGCGDAVGRYTVTHEGTTLTLGLIDDECTGRGEIMPGQYALVE